MGKGQIMSHYSDTLKHCDTFAEWKDCDKHKDFDCYRLECAVCDWTARDCEEDKEICLMCNENKEENGLIVCSKCNEREGK
jgi:hypothetical protein